MVMTAVQAGLLMLLVCSGLLAVTGWLRTDLLGLSVLFVLAVTGLLTPQEAFVGFSSPAVITLAGLFVLTEAMNRAGFVHWIAERVMKLTGKSENGVTTVFILTGATLSLFVNTAAAGAVLLPAVMSVAAQRKISPSKLLLPMGFGVIVGGTATIFTTANIIMSGLLEAQGHPGLTLADFFPTGFALVLVTLAAESEADHEDQCPRVEGILLEGEGRHPASLAYRSAPVESFRAPVCPCLARRLQQARERRRVDKDLR